jgi:FAD/FMN-containing dehydrogenase
VNSAKGNSKGKNAPPAPLPSEAVAGLKAGFRGELIQPGDSGYDSARKVYNAMIDRKPRLIAQCTDVADVIAAVKFARANKLLTSVRGGGHNAGGLGVCDAGVVIDLSRMKGVRVDTAARTARVAGGSVWGDVDHATHAFGLAAPAGVISTTGVAGLTLGGGLGHLTRRYGYTIDNLLGVDMVLADGSFVTADEKQNTDLFWAVRGGGGNFGVVTSFLFRLHPVNTVLAGPTLWPAEQATDVLGKYRNFIVNAPENVGGFFMFMQVPPAPMFPENLHGKKMCGIMWCGADPAAEAEKAMAPMRKFGKPALDMVGEMPWPAVQSLFDPLYPPGLQWYWRADFFREISDEAIAQHAKYGPQLPTGLSSMHLYPVDGAAHRVGKADTAFNSRDAVFAEVIIGVDPDPANNEKISSWAKEYWQALHPYSSGGAYLNFIMEEGQERIRATYRENYDRLAAIKKKYDPENFFRVNQNILPAK